MAGTFKKLHFFLVGMLCINVVFYANAQEPKLMLPIGHTDEITAASFSPDGKYVISGSSDQTFKVWETWTGKKLLDVGNFTGEIKYCFFSNDGNYFAAGTDSSVVVYKTNSFAQLGEFPYIKKIFFSPDSQRFFLLDFKGGIEQITLPAIQIERYYRDSVSEKTIAASFDNKFFCYASGSLLTIWDLQKGKIVSSQKVNGEPQRCFFGDDNLRLIVVTEGGIREISFENNFKVTNYSSDHISQSFLSKNQRFLLTVEGNSRGGLILRDFKENKKITAPKANIFLDDTTFIIDNDGFITGRKTGTLKFGWPLGYIDGITEPKITNDGKHIYIQDLMWNYDTSIHSYSVKAGSNFPVRSFDVCNDNNHLLFEKKTGEICLFDIITQKTSEIYKSNSVKIQFADISTNGEKLLVGSDNTDIKILDANNGHLLLLLKGLGNDFASAQFNETATEILTNSYDSTSRLWDGITGTLLKSFPHHFPYIDAGHFDESGNVTFNAVEYDTIKRFDMDGNATNFVLTPHVEPDSAQMFRHGVGKHYGFVLAKETDGGITLTDSVGIKENLILKVQLQNEGSLSSPHSRHWATIGVQVHDILSFRIINSNENMFTVEMRKYAKSFSTFEGIVQMEFADDAQYLFLRCINRVVYVVSAKTFERVDSLTAEKCYLSTDSRYLLSVNQGEAFLYDFEQRMILYRYIFVDSSNYLVVDKFGRFDGSEAARKLLYFTCGTEVISLDQVKDQLWVPNLAERIMKGDSINAPKLSDLNICGLVPLVEHSGPDSGFHYTITPRRGGLGETVMYVNGIEVKRYKPTQLTKTATGYSLVITPRELQHYFIAGQENPVTVKAFTAQNDIASRNITTIHREEKKALTQPNLYAVMIGVSDYKGDELDLRYAAKDATDLSNTLAASARKLLNRGGKEHVFMYDLTTENNHYLLPEKNSIKKVLDSIGRKATTNDILFIFFAGHGVMRGDKMQFYFLTADASKATATDAPASVGISTQELSDWMKPENIKAQKRILIFDACNSGQAINELVKIGNAKDNYLAARNDDRAEQIKAIEKLNEKSGFYILSASASNQGAYEMGRYSQGLLTYALLKAVKEQPDILDDNRYLNVSRWFNAAEKNVSDIAAETGAQQQPQVVTSGNFNVGIVDTDVIAGIKLPEEKALFTASNFQNEDDAIADDDLGLNRLTDNKLGDVSARGTDNPIRYIPITSSPDAYSLSGRYEVKSDSVKVKVNIKQNKAVQHRFEVTGTKGGLEKLAGDIVGRITDWLSKRVM